MNSEQKAYLVQICISLLSDRGVIVTLLTPLNLVSHFSFGFFVLHDPHMIKLIRNCFAEMDQFLDENDNVLDFNYIIKLNNLQTTEGLHLGKKLRS